MGSSGNCRGYSRLLKSVNLDKSLSTLMKGKNKTAPPHGIKLYAGSLYIIATREFINWTMNNSTAQKGIHESSMMDLCLVNSNCGLGPKESGFIFSTRGPSPISAISIPRRTTRWKVRWMYCRIFLEELIDMIQSDILHSNQIYYYSEFWWSGRFYQALLSTNFYINF